MRIIRNLFIIIFFLISALITNAQILEWDVTLSNSSSILNTQIAIHNGYIYGGGSFFGNVVFDSSGTTISHTSIGAHDVVFFKYDTSGNYIWSKSIGSTGTDKLNKISIDNSGNIVITGICGASSIDVDPGPGTSNLTYGSGWRQFLLKYDSNGDLTWAKPFVNMGVEDIISHNTDKSDNIYVTGAFTSSPNFDPPSSTSYASSNGGEDIYLAKYSSNGAFLNVISMGSNYNLHDQGLNVTIDDDYNIFMSGVFQDTVDFDPDPMDTFLLGAKNNDKDAYFLKLDSAFDFQWAFAFGGLSHFDRINDIAISNLGKVIVTGQFVEADFDPDTVDSAYYTSNGNWDAFVACYTQTGNFEWVNTFGGSNYNYSNSVSIGDDNGIVITGGFQGSADFDPGSDTSERVSFGDYDVFLTKYDSNGDLSWTYNAGSVGRDIGNTVVTSNEKLFVSGLFSGIADFDLGPGFDSLTSLGQEDGFIVAYRPCLPANPPILIASDSMVCPGTNVVLSDTLAQLNDAEYLAWHVDSCNGPMIDSGLSITVSPNTSTTYFVKNEGWCITTDTCYQITSTVSDTSKPIPLLSSLPDSVVFCNVVVGIPTAIDSCFGIILGTTSDSTSFTTQGVRTITWSFDDGHGNVEYQTQNVIVDDTVAPIPLISSLPDSISFCSVSVVPPKAVDNCADTIIGTTTDSTTYTTQGNRTITWTYDDGHGNLVFQTQNVVVLDTIGPVPILSVLPDSIVQCNVTVSSPQAIDNCSGVIIGTTLDSTTFTTQGIRTITWRYTDALGNFTLQSQNVIVADTIGPIPNLSGLPTVFGLCDAEVMAPSATDNCSGVIIGTTTDSTLFSTQGLRIINWNYTDSKGNISTQQQIIIVKDSIDPIVNCPSNLKDSIDGITSTVIVNNIDAVVVDSCGYQLTYTLSGSTTASGTGSASGSSFNVGVTSVTYEVVDEGGNMVNCTFDIEIVDPFVGIEESKLNIYSIFPNPFNELLNIKFKRQVKTGFIQIIDVQGSKVYDQNFSSSDFISLNLEEISGGLYFIQITADGTRWQERLVKE